MEPGRARTLLCFCHRVDGSPEESAVVDLLRSFFLGGFECSSHRRADGERLDLIASSGHEELALEDYLQLKAHGISTARDGLRWHIVEQSPGQYDWSSFIPLLQRELEVQQRSLSRASLRYSATEEQRA